MIWLGTALLALCTLGAALRWTELAVICWILIVESSPDMWLAPLTGGYETIIAAMKGAGLLLALLLMLRGHAGPNRYNPTFAFIFMFCTGLLHGLYPGLSLLSSLRSLVGSAAPFAFGFVKNPPASWRRAVLGTVQLAPLAVVAFGAVLQLAGVHGFYDVEQNTLRLGGSGEPAFLAGFTLIGIYAGLMAQLVRLGRAGAMLLLANFIILLATGARAPLALAVLVGLGFLLLPSNPLGARTRLIMLAGLGALAALAVIFAPSIAFIRPFGLARLGEAASLSHRGLVWPYFEAAIAQSPFVGWGVGAGKLVLPVSAPLSAALGTNAAHNEYLRIGVEGGLAGVLLLVGLITAWVWRGSAALPVAQRSLLRLILFASAIHAATDNTLIATTSSIFFIWMAALFATPTQTPKGEI